MNAKGLKPVLLSGFICFDVLLAVVWLLPVEFTAITDSHWGAIAYGLTESAGWTGTTIILVLASLFFGWQYETWSRKMRMMVLQFIALAGLLSVFALLNEHIVKPALAFQRPSHQYIINQSGSTVSLDSLYALDTEARRKLIGETIKSKPGVFKHVSPYVVNHWIYEAGYSFPSGHSFNAFLLAGFLSFGIFRLKTGRWLVALPFLWAAGVAISRVALGAHSALDVTVGAAMGLVISFLLITLTNKISSSSKNT